MMSKPIQDKALVVKCPCCERYFNIITDKDGNVISCRPFGIERPTFRQLADMGLVFGGKEDTQVG